MFRKVTMAAAVAVVSLGLAATGASASEKNEAPEVQAASATLLLSGWGCPIGGGWSPGGPGWGGGPGGPGPWGPGPNGSDLQGTELDSDDTVEVVDVELPE